MRRISLFGIAVLAVLLMETGCERSQPRQPATTSVQDLEPVLDTRTTDAKMPRDDGSTSRTFMGYDCTQDCSGHEAGYQWAEEHGIDDPDDCGGNSQSFIEGCRAYAEKQGDDTDDDNNDD